jgi:hypothetical protein
MAQKRRRQRSALPAVIQDERRACGDKQAVVESGRRFERINNQGVLFMFKKILYLLFLVIVIISCINTKNNVGPEQIETAVQSEEAMEIRPIDIKAPKFFWLLKPWKEGKLATIDGWGRFAEISFEKKTAYA